MMERREAGGPVAGCWSIDSWRRSMEIMHENSMWTHGEFGTVILFTSLIKDMK